MNSLLRKRSWTVLFSILWGSLGLFALLLTYHIVVGSFSGVDGGFGLAAGIFYGIIGIIIIGILSFLHWVTKKRDRLNTLVLCIAFLGIAITAISAGTYSIQQHLRNGRVQQIEAALSNCTVKSVHWQYSPGLTAIAYRDGTPSVKVDGYTDPTKIGSLTEATELRCRISIQYFINNELTQHPY